MVSFLREVRKGLFRGGLIVSITVVDILSDEPEDSIEYGWIHASTLHLHPWLSADGFAIVPVRELPFLNQAAWDQVLAQAPQRSFVWHFGQSHVCAICLDPISEGVITSCDHRFHASCLLTWEHTSGRHSCPMCRHSYSLF